MKFKIFYEEQQIALNNNYDFQYPKPEGSFEDYIKSEYVKEISQYNIPKQKALLLGMEQYIRENPIKQFKQI